jgi:GPH family glycoside/pentoside/hexuronide:cation symporter
LVGIINVFFDPVTALLMDRTKTPIGRYRPWLVVGTPLAMLGVAALLMPPGPVSELYVIVFMFLSFAGLSMATLGQTAWSAVLAVTYDDRSRLWGWFSALGVVATVLVLLLPVFTGGAVVAGRKASMPVIGWIFVIWLPIALVITAALTPERVVTAVKKPRFSLSDYRRAIGRPIMARLMCADFLLALGPGVTGPLYLFFFHDAKGFTVNDISVLLIFYILAGVFGSLFWGRYLAERLGKHRTLQISCVAYAVTQSTLMAWPRVWPGYTWIDCIPTAVLMFGVGFCNAAFLIMVRAMVADVIDEVRLETKQDLTSLLYSMVTTTTKIGGSITVAVVYPILALVGYNGAEGAINTKSAIFGLEMCYLFAPVILVLMGGMLFFGYRLDSSRHAEIRRALEAPDFLAAEQGLIARPIDPQEQSAAAG